MNFHPISRVADKTIEIEVSLSSDVIKEMDKILNVFGKKPELKTRSQFITDTLYVWYNRERQRLDLGQYGRFDAEGRGSH